MPRPLVTLIAVLATASASLMTVAAPSAADHGEATSVALVGSLQSELGCAEDWKPECPATDLTESDEGEWSAEFDVPEGSWELKVALNDLWDFSYGVDGGETNIPLVLLEDARVEVSFDETSHLVTLAPAEAPSDEVTAEDRALAGLSLREPLTRERFYFVMADRFANGDSANDRGGISGDRLENGFDPADKGFFHGGDIAGLRSKLDYIAGLGTTAIWLTPSFKNRAVQGTDPDASAGYHGYWVTDFTQIDPHFGTNQELTAFIDAAHARGIKVFFDIITNHTADVIDYEEGQYSYVSKATEPYRDAQGQPFDDAEHADGEPPFPELDPQVSFPYTPVFRSEADEGVKVPAWLNDPIYYHNRGDSTFAGESSTYGDFIGLDDLFTEHPVVVEGMTDIYRTWVEFGIDGFRIDTVKHVNMEFWQQFAPAIREAAAEVGNEDFFAFGEVFDSSPAYMSGFTTDGRLDATLDFGFQSVGTSFAKEAETVRLRDFLAADDYYTDTDSNAYALPTFLGNHDMGRIGHFLDDVYADAELLERDQLAHALMYLTRGQPVVYYGDEQGFTGPGGDKDARQDMFATETPDYLDDDLIGTDSTHAADNFDSSHPLYQRIQALAQLRARHPALADGAQLHRYASRSTGVYAFSRIGRAQRREFVVALNNSDSDRTVPVTTLRRLSQYRQVWPTTTGRLRSDAEGRVALPVPARGAVVYRAQRRVAPRSVAPAVRYAAPVAGGVVGDRAEIRAAVLDGGFNEVTHAWRPLGSDEWTPLGTDDNAPYRVFHDVSGLADGTLVEYRAILRDSSGNLSVDSTYAVVGDPVQDPGGPGGPVIQPDAVAAAGSFNSEIGCPNDWEPWCDQAQLTLDPTDEIWKKKVTVPIGGDYEYKAALNRLWEENYGQGGVLNGANIPFQVPAGGSEVGFYYDHRTHWITSDAEGPIVTAAGSFQSELGCPGDWAPECMRSWLQDPDGDGTYTFVTADIPAGSHEIKVAHGLSWDENYGQDGVFNGANIPFSVGVGQEVVFSYDLASHVLTVTTRTAGDPGATPDLAQSKAQWLRRGLIAWDVTDPETRRYRLHWSASGDLAVDAEDIGGTSVPLRHDPAGLPARVLEDFPHLADYEVFRLRGSDLRRVPDILRGQAAVASYTDLGAVYDATGVQTPGVLDDVYAGARDRTLGVSWSRGRPTLALWAPTAQAVTLLVWTEGAPDPRRVPMGRSADGTWTVRGDPGWRGATYLYEVTVFAPSTGEVETNQVTDPYSLALTTNSQRSVMVDLRDPTLRPAGWASLRPPSIARPEDRAIYELHVRDFSIGDESVPEAERGTYLAFTRTDSAGMTHLRSLAEAGLNTVHLLPAFDIATIEEERSAQAEPGCDLASFPPDSEQQQECVDDVRGRDGFNWGYDPFHYTAPEGSYATDPDGPGRTLEFRRMVQGLNQAGLQVVMDVVYNHTAAAGQDPKSVLDRVVPGYYHRLNATGAVENSTCCSNTASEHLMMEKLLIDSVLTWARDYKVNGFRFDLMGHHSLANMTRLREALDRLTLARDGVDGRAIYLYGEGWNFGEVADDARFEQATQLNLAGSGIGSFSDRLRDAVRGGGPFDGDPRVQGFGSGLLTDDNGAQNPDGTPLNGSPDEQRAGLLLDMDLVKVGLAGNLASYQFVDRNGDTVTGAEVDYNGQPAGYAADPSETVTYVDAHDNETLFDSLTFKLPVATSMADRVRMNTVSLSTVALGQGVAFWHAGVDLLRSKSLDRNSYDSGDWFNRVDWTGAENTFGSGLPLRGDNADKWDYMRPLLGDPSKKPDGAAMAASRAAAADLLRIRSSSRLFRLGSRELIQQKLKFLPSDPGVIVMWLDDSAGNGVDPARDGILVVFNATPGETTVGGVGEGWELHEVQAEGADEVVKGSTTDPAGAGGTGLVTVPARTTAVFTR